MSMYVENLKVFPEPLMEEKLARTLLYYLRKWGSPTLEVTRYRTMTYSREHGRPTIYYRCRLVSMDGQKRRVWWKETNQRSRWAKA